MTISKDASLLRTALLAAVLLGYSAAALAQAPDCAAPATLPPEFATWAHPVPLFAAVDAAAAPLLAPGVAAALALHPVAHVRLVQPPAKPGAAGSHGGLLAFDVAQAGTWRVALATAAWIDVLADGKPVTSTGHGHGPACSGIRKLVDFSLKPGRHILQVAGSAAPNQVVQVTRLP